MTYSTDLLLQKETEEAAGTNAVFQSVQVLQVQAHQDLSVSSAVQHVAYDEILIHTQILVATERMDDYGVANSKISVPKQYR